MSALPFSREEFRLQYAAKCGADPWRFMDLAYPWGQAGTALERHDGLEKWQSQVVDLIAAGIKARQFPIKIAVASGHGVGKSALVGMISDWALSTMPDTRVVVTANTEPQLRTKTWPEIAKWRGLSVTAPWFRIGETTIDSVDPAHKRSWRLDRIAWSEHKSEAFAGLHNQGKRIVVIFDEASAIADVIWDVTSGALTDTDTEIIWLAFGNPTRNTGRFRDCFGAKLGWQTLHVDSREVRFTNKTEIDRWIDLYGEDHDFVRVRVRGAFPRQSLDQFIPQHLVAAARRAAPVSMHIDPVCVGIDFARDGESETVLVRRKGRDARSLPAYRWREPDSARLADKIMEKYVEDRRLNLDWDYVWGDDGGIGGPIIDHLRRRGLPITGVKFGDSSSSDRYANRAAEMWARMRDWLHDGGCIQNDDDLEDQLCKRDGWLDRRDRLTLQPKDEMRDLGIASPDWADALALTFAQLVTGKPAAVRSVEQQVIPTRHEYKPLERKR